MGDAVSLEDGERRAPFCRPKTGQPNVSCVYIEFDGDTNMPQPLILQAIAPVAAYEKGTSQIEESMYSE